MSKLYVVNDKRGLKAFLRGRGFYLVVMLCVAAVGALGYYTLMDAMKPDGSLVIGEESGSSSRNVSSAVKEKEVSQAPSRQETSSAQEKTEDVINPGSTKTVVYSAPVAGPVIKVFSLEELLKSATMGDFRPHTGVDIAAKLGTPVAAAAAGVVEDASMDRDDLLGMVIEIKHSDGRRTIYANLDKNITVKPGDTVQKGEIIGTVGKTAQCELLDPPHLHFEVIVDGGQVDPLTIMTIPEN